MRKIIDEKVSARDGQVVMFALIDMKGEKCETYAINAFPAYMTTAGAGEAFEFMADDVDSACRTFKRFVEAGRRGPTKRGHYLICPVGFRKR